MKKRRKKKEPTNAYNIFRVLEKNTISLKQSINDAGLTKTGELHIDGFSLSFYFSKKPPLAPVKWMELYSEFLSGESMKHNKVYYGALIIEKKDFPTYTISLGKSHFYIRKHADTDFGLDLAQRIVSPTTLKKKLSKHYFSVRNQSLTTYRMDSNIDYESGESFHYLRSSTVDSDKWGENVTFGHSVLLNLSILPRLLPTKVLEIEKTLKSKPKIELPRVEKIQDEKQIQALDKKLAQSINKGHNTTSIEELIISGKDILMTENICYSLYHKGDRKSKSDTIDLSLDEIKQYAKQQNIRIEDEIDNIFINVETEYGDNFKEPLKYFLDYVDNDRNCLIDGKWHKFNQSYIDFLQEYVKTIDMEYDPTLDLDNTVLETYLKKNKKSYAEDFFNTQREKEGYSNLDKNIQVIGGGKYKIEAMDLYKNGCMYFVKIGTPQKLAYVFDQAMNTLRSLQSKEIEIISNGRKTNPKKNCVWLVLERKTDINFISDIESLILMMKVSEWIRYSNSIKNKPLLKINYRR